MPNANGKTIKCRNCGKNIYRPLNSLLSVKDPCCSYACAKEFSRRNKVHLACKICNKKIIRSKGNIKSKNQYCSSKCKNKDNGIISAKNISNYRFNYLTAIERVFKARREWVWKCNCDCGKTTNVRISKLINGMTKSCGCFKEKNLKHESGPKHRGWMGYKDISKSFYTRMKNSAELRNLEFKIKMEYLWWLYKKRNGQCAFTGKKIALPTSVSRLRGENNEDVASLDRIDNDKGYIEGNLQWTCKRINYMKHTMTEEYFLEWIKAAYEFRIKPPSIRNH